MNAYNVDEPAKKSKDEMIVDQRMELLRRRWRHHSSVAPPATKTQTPQPEITVAISRQAGALGSEVARDIGKQLDWPVYDREILDMIAERSVLRTELLESLDEHDRSWLVEVLATFGDPHGISSAGYLRHLQDVLGTLSSQGKCVLVGRGATGFLPPAQTLRVRVIAPFEKRVERIAQLRNISTQEAQRVTQAIDKERGHFMATHFKKDINDPHGFDLIVNTERMPSHVCAELVARSVEAKSIQAAAK